MDLLSMGESEQALLQFVNLDRLPQAVLIFVVALGLTRLMSRSLDALGERITDRRLLFKQIAEIGRLAVIVISTVLTAMTLFEFSGEALYGLFGLAAVGVGYASRDLLSSIMAGFVLIFDRPFQVGDRIAFDGHYGEVREIGLRLVRLVDLDDNVIF